MYPVLDAPEPGHIEIAYRVTECLDDASIQALWPLLSPDERDRCQRFMFARDRRDFAAAHVLLRRTLSRYGDLAPEAWTFVVDTNGKPSLPPAAGCTRPVSFNISHTHGLVACAVARDVDVGVDVEAIDRAADGLEIAERFFARAELAELEGCAASARAERFTELWTLKEAYLKAVGSGLAHPLDTFAFRFGDDDRNALWFTPPPGASATDWTFALYAPSPRHRLAIAVPSGSRDGRLRVVCAEQGHRAIAPVRITGSYL